MSKGLISVVSKKIISHCLVEMVLCVSSSLSLRCYEESIDKVGQSASLPGFRKGKIPRQHILNSFREKIEYEWNDSLAKIVIQMELNNLDTKIIPPVQYNWTKLSIEEDCELVIHFEQHPSVPDWNEIDFSSLERHEKQIIGENEVEKKLYEYSKVLGEWTDLEVNSVVLEEDRVSYSLFSEDKKLISEEQNLLLDQINCTSLRNVIIGSSVGNEINYHLTEESELLPMGKYSIFLKSASRKIPVPMDESFAKRFNVESMEILREETTKRLQKMSDLDYLETIKDALQSFLVDVLIFDLPQSLVKKEVESRQVRKENRSEEEQKELLEQSEKALRLFFFVELIATKQSITLSKEQIDFIWTQNSPGKTGEHGRQRMTAQLIHHESLVYILRQLEWV